MKYAMGISSVKYVVDHLMSTRLVTRVSYLISGHNLVTCYIMGPNYYVTSSVILTVLNDYSAKYIAQQPHN